MTFKVMRGQGEEMTSVPYQDYFSMGLRLRAEASVSIEVKIVDEQ